MSRKKINICFVTEDFYPSPIGGQGIYGKELISVLVKQGINVTVMAENRPGRRAWWESIKNVDLHLVPNCHGFQLALSLLYYIYFLLVLRDQHFDILHANQLTALFFVLWRPKNIDGIVVTSHNTYEQMAQATLSKWKRILYQPFIKLERVVYQKSDAIICHVESQRLYMHETYGIKKQKLFVVPMGISPVGSIDKKLMKEKISRQLAFSSKIPIVLYVGRVVARKRVDLVCEVMKKLPDVQAIIVGEGKALKSLEKITSENVRFVGKVSDVSQYYQAADVFITVSRAEGGVILSSYEAASYGLPLVLSADAADPEILEQGKNGYILYSNSLKEIEEAIRSCLINKSRFFQESIRRARLLSWNRSAKQTRRVYEQMIEKGLGKKQ